MPPPKSRFWPQLLAHGYLTPFAALALYGLAGLLAWRTGSLGLVQPRSYDAVLPANACACLVLLGLAPILVGFRWPRTGLALGSLATLLAWATLIQDPLNLDFGIDDLLVRHESVVAGLGVARMPAALSFVLMFSGLLFTWLAARSGPQVKARVPGDSGAPVLCPAPGTYVVSDPNA